MKSEIIIIGLKDEDLVKISRDNLLALDVHEMKVIRAYYEKLGRNPTDIELETIAQTWSEHCKHKTLTGNIEYESDDSLVRSKTYDNLLKSTIFRATQELDKKWCISVFKDNAGIIEFDKDNAVAFKVETHNHPSALEPYGGAGTGIGGVIRDILGVGLGAKPVLNTDIFCFGNLDAKYGDLPRGVLHPKRIMKGVVSGVRDYGNRMGIPTANGAVLFDERYACNPLVYCGTLGIMPKSKCFKKVTPGCLILAAGGRTGRDGIHGATFSSLAMDKDTPLTPVQIGNAIVEKKVTDTVLQARDEGLYSAITDCGAGGFSSAVGELGEDCGARVYLDRTPLKYEGITPWEIWVSEAQERMVMAVPPEKLDRILEIFKREDVETTVLGEFTDTGRLEVLYKDEKICDLEMEFLHKGLPRRKRQARWKLTRHEEPKVELSGSALRSALRKVLASPNVCSKEWVIRQYDHEVQAQTVLKPLQGRLPFSDGPGDACVICPLEGGKESCRGIAVACGINPNYGNIDPYWMAASAIDEALRNVVSAGGDLGRTALLDNFCWGNCNRPEQLAGVVRASEACYDMAKAFGVPFISGKDSLNNEFIDENNRAISIPPTLLISAVSIVPDIRKAVSVDLKSSGNLVYALGETKDELGGSQYYRLLGFTGNTVPKVDPRKSFKLMTALGRAIRAGVVKACHDCSDGGLAVTLAEMAFAGGFGLDADLSQVPADPGKSPAGDALLMFSESNGRFAVEIAPSKAKEFEKIMKGNAVGRIGKVRRDGAFAIKGLNGKVVLKDSIDSLKKSWQGTLKNL
jgi:phosphoribosylformylglycinamidine synthase II